MACLFVGACLFPSLSFSSIVKDQVFVKNESFHSFEQVCESLLQRESPLIEAKSSTKLDCMGSVVDVNDFCKKEFREDTSYARAMVESADNKVKCQRASRVIMSYACSGSGGLCEDQDIGCYRLQERFAVNLFLAHASVTGASEKSKKLNCYFSAASPTEVLKPRF